VARPLGSDPIRRRAAAAKVPRPGTFSLARVNGPYRFAIHPEGDLGHILPVEVLRFEIPNSNVHVSAGIQRTLRQRAPIWEITHLAADVEGLLTQAAGQLATRDTDLERLELLRSELIEQLGTSLRQAFGGNQFEAPVRRLLEALYRRGTVDYTGGPSERGADFVVDDVDPFGFERRIVFQLKAWDGVVSDEQALDQLRKAIETRDADEAFLLTTAIEESPEFAIAREKLQRELSVPIRLVNGEILAGLFLENLPNLVAS
jgi:Restriction endonuclease